MILIMLHVDKSEFVEVIDWRNRNFIKSLVY